MFNPANSIDADAIDVTATITNVRATCEESTATISSRRSRSTWSRRGATPAQARQVVLPYFDVGLQGGHQVVAKRVGRIGLNFAPAACALKRRARRPSACRVRRRRCLRTSERQLTRARKAGDADRGDRSADRSGGPRRGRQCDVRASGRLPADRAAAPLQRHALARCRSAADSALTARARQAKAPPVSGGASRAGRPRGRVRGFLKGCHGAEGATAPGISQAKGPRAPDSLESVRSLTGRTTEGVTPAKRRGKLSGRSDRRGRRRRRMIRTAVATGAPDEQKSTTA